MPIAGTITPSGAVPTPTPSAAREAHAAAKAGAAAAAPAAGAPVAERGRAAAPATADGAAPTADQAPAPEQYEAWRVEALARKEREATQARLALKTERETLARERDAHAAREAQMAEREKRISDVEKRLSSYRYNPHLALQDLAAYGVSFEQLAQAVAQGMATPDQIAAAEAASARREVEEFRREQAAREQREQETERDREQREQREQETARQRTERERQEARQRAEETATREWQSELKAVIARDPEAFPLVAARLDRGALDVAFGWAEQFLQKEGRVPTNEEVLQAVEADMEADVDAASRALAGRQRRPAAPPASIGGLRPGPAAPAPAGPSSEADRRARALAAIDRAFGRTPRA